MQGDVVDIVAAAYRVEQPPSEWLRGVLESARPLLDRGSGVTGYFVDCSEDARCRTWGYESVDLFDDCQALWSAYEGLVPEEIIHRVHTVAPAAWSTALPPEAMQWGSSRDIRGALGINALDASRRGVTLVGFDRSQRAPPTDADVARWSFISAHIAAGARLGSRLTEPEAVLRTDGGVVHADGAARAQLARECLRRAVVGMMRARTRRGRASPDEALASWEALVAGRWSLIDTFESDGRHYVVARPNEPMPRPMALTRRERQVVAAVGLGHANKLIAYELGLRPSTVATLLSRAMRKLDLSSRLELVRWARTHRAAAETDDG